MISSSLSLEAKEDYIRKLTILKLKKCIGFITDDEFQEELIDLNMIYESSNFTETLSKIAFEKILNLIKDMEFEENGVEILFNEVVDVHYNGQTFPKICDVVLLGSESIEVIKIISYECDFIHASEDIEVKLLGLASIDKFLAGIKSDLIRLTIVQPNLMTTSIYTTEIVGLLHDFEYSLL